MEIIHMFCRKLEHKKSQKNPKTKPKNKIEHKHYIPVLSGITINIFVHINFVHSVL